MTVVTATATAVTLGFTESDRADDYSSYCDGYRPGAAQATVTLAVPDPDGPAPSLDDWAQAAFDASNTPAYAAEHPLVTALRAALADARRSGAQMRSLSIGDTVTVGGRTVACDKGVGWKPVTLVTPRVTVEAAAEVFGQLCDAATGAYRALLANPASSDLREVYDTALADLEPFFASYAQAHAAVGAFIAEADRFALHIHLNHGGYAELCNCPA